MSGFGFWLELQLLRRGALVALTFLGLLGAAHLEQKG